MRHRKPRPNLLSWAPALQAEVTRLPIRELRVGHHRALFQAVICLEAFQVGVLAVLRKPLRAPQEQALAGAGIIQVVAGAPAAPVRIEQFQILRRRLGFRTEERIVAEQRELPVAVEGRDVFGEDQPV